MNDSLINLASRMKNDFYVGVVGPCRSGKSTFINSFFKEMIIPIVNDDFIKNKIVDEMPQTSFGKQIMTVEPKFIPSNSFELEIDGIKMNIRFVDCVGEIIPSSEGYGTDKEPRMVKTPWFDDPISFKEAASIGTEKVIYSHSNLGIYITSDGSFGDFTRTDYEEIDNKLIPKLKNLNKPFVIILNTKNPTDSKAIELKNELEEKWETSVVVLNNTLITKDDCNNILKKALEEFPIEDLQIKLPDYIDVLADDYPLKKEIYELVSKNETKYNKMKEINLLCDSLKESNVFSDVKLELIDAKNGACNIILELDDSKYKEIVEDLLGTNVTSKASFIKYLYQSKINNEMLSDVNQALIESKQTGYGISKPSTESMEMLEPTVVKKNGMYGVRLAAKAKVTHMVTVDVLASFTPIIGSVDQANMLVNSLGDKDELWNKEFFGRKLSDIVNDSLKAKIININDNSKLRIKEVLEKISNNDRNNLIAIII